MSDFRGVARSRAWHAVRGVGRWAVSRRRMAADQFVRGTAYGAGTAVAGLFALWVRTRC
ncbi:hypothetical protein G3I19_23060 [Streptomyces sp. SID10853]|uniref:hypothetical protein n=1 Tax=Streptomyces sp. SID10853 TaxID=2706028 RepID=UPI0013C08673|nr:hypothetical protein [Streptomyces sp. SID10853]NDZ81357.1 hypothetical protein [Streptomyces sp. SID10853]